MRISLEPAGGIGWNQAPCHPGLIVVGADRRPSQPSLAAIFAETIISRFAIDTYSTFVEESAKSVDPLRHADRESQRHENENPGRCLRRLAHLFESHQTDE